MKILKIKELVLESNERITDLSLAYQTFGNLNEDKSNVVWVFHAISGDSNVLSWWSGLFGEGKIYDPQDHFIICANCIGSPFGSSHPKNSSFPQFTIRDQVKAYLKLSNHLNIHAIHTIIGGSFGGYQALEFAYSFKGEIDHMILLASSARESAWGIAVHEAQRMALEADASFGQLGGGFAGLKAARALGVLTYRTSEKLIEDQTDDTNQFDGNKASDYMKYQGNKFSKSFDSLCLHFLTKCIDSHNIGRKRGGELKALQKITIPSLIIGFKSDLLVPIQTQRFLANHLPKASFTEIDSTYGHDGFLMEFDKITKSINTFYKNSNSDIQKRKLLKFGGSSLYGKEQLENFLEIIKSEYSKGPIALVVSAVGKTTDKLLALYELAKEASDFTNPLNDLKDYIKQAFKNVDIETELNALKQILDAIKLLHVKSDLAKDRVLIFGELISAKIISSLLQNKNYHAEVIDARECLIADLVHGQYEINSLKSKEATLQRFDTIDIQTIPVITGYIASNINGDAITLGRNGSNYSASLFASFLNVSEVQNWTDIDGIYSADPTKVSSAIKIEKMNYTEANELASFGMNLLHSKTILPLKKSNIPLVIKSTKHPTKKGTTINQNGGEKGIKAVTSIRDITLVTIEGNRLKHNIGIDARIFAALKTSNINVKMISQASTENGIGFIVSSDDSLEAERCLHREFNHELSTGTISSIMTNDDVGIIAIIGRHNFSLEKAISTLRKNGIWMHLISNSISGKHISLVIDNSHLDQAINLVHNEVYGTIKTLHVFSIGKGKVGSEFIDQVINTSKEIVKSRTVKINLIGVCDSERYILDQGGISADWKSKLAKGAKYNSIMDLITRIKDLYVNNIVIVDNTASNEISEYYESFINNNFDIVASNKTKNSGDLLKYDQLRKTIKSKGRKFHYETNVGAGLPIINLIKTLHNSSDIIYKIRGVFSGSLSYIFNNFSSYDLPISTHIKKAVELGYAEPDPRIDMTGLDVARKLIILAREIGFKASLEDVEIDNLIPPSLRKLDSVEEFDLNESELNNHYADIKKSLSENQVLRYMAELNVHEKKLSVKLVAIDKSEPIAQIKNADNYFEVFTNSYENQPIIIQGKGAGPIVTARGVYSDVLRLA